eukprot:TRINITY_DN112_c2_g2_i4.p1 TRINITY_DN112_c2_g2~~TRINITY_DN112_c2_g2_i4.p1  ORF type:complete len:933 (+),score=324.84 TRINITY_DN112_c2_g2_i4:93-2801(+)
MSRPRGQSGVGRAESPTGGSPSGRKLSLPGGGGGSGGSGVKVMVRVRPFNSREKELSREKGEPLRCIVEMNGKNCIVLDETNDYEPRDIPAFVFDECLWSLPEDEHNPMSPNGFANQHTVYEKGGAEALTNAWEGYNTCIFAYGQTGAGKSFSMLGSPELPGIAPQLITNLFKHVDKQKEECPELMFNVEVTFFEIYMEKVKDLFNKGKKDSEYSDVKIRQHPLWGIQVQGLETKAVKTEAECAAEMDYGVSQRSLASTKMNATSSRSHAIFQIHINQNNVKTKAKSTATINLVDLAGSERIGKTGATGATKEEGMAINLSLSTLRKVMDALVDQSKGKKTNPPYRESMLTWVLKESLGGNSKTVMITAISPHYDNLEDTISTLRYGLKAKAIVNKAVKQETSANKQAAEFKAKVAELEEQLRLAQEQGTGGGASSEEIEEMQRELQLQKDAESQVKGELEDMEAKAAGLEVELANAKKRAFAAAFRNAFGAQKKREAAEQLQARVGELERNERMVQDELSTVSEQRDKLESDLRKSQQALLQMQEQLADGARELEQERIRLRDEMREALHRTQQEHSQALTSHTEEQAAAHREQLSSQLGKQRDAHEREKEELRSKMQIEIDGHRGQSAERGAEIAALRRRVGELEPLMGELERAHEERDALRQEAGAQAQELQACRAQIAELHRSLQQRQSSYEQLAMQSERDAAHHRQKLDELRAEQAEMRRDRDQFRKQVLTLQVLHSVDSRVIRAMSSTGSPSAPDAARSPSPGAVRATLGGHTGSAVSPRAASPPLPGGVYHSGSGGDGGASSWRERVGASVSPGADDVCRSCGSCRRCGSPVRGPYRAGPAASPSPAGGAAQLRGVARLAAELPGVYSPGQGSVGRLSAARGGSPSPHSAGEPAG